MITQRSLYIQLPRVIISSGKNIAKVDSRYCDRWCTARWDCLMNTKSTTWYTSPGKITTTISWFMGNDGELDAVALWLPWYYYSTHTQPYCSLIGWYTVSSCSISLYWTHNNEANKKVDLVTLLSYHHQRHRASNGHPFSLSVR